MTAVCAALAILTAATPCTGVILDIVGRIAGGFLAGKAAGDVVEDLNNRADHLMRNAAREGDLLRERALDDIKLLIRTAEIAIGDQREALVDDLDAASQRLLGQAFDALHTLETNAAADARDLIDRIELGVNSIAEDTGVLLNPKKLFMQSIKGLRVPPTAGKLHQVEILASTLGSREDVRTKIELLLKNEDGAWEPVPIETDQSQKKYQATVLVPTERLNRAARLQDVVRVPAQWEFQVSRPRCILSICVFGESRTDERFDSTFEVLPRIAGTAQVSVDAPEEGWVKLGEVTKPYVSGDRSYLAGEWNRPRQEVVGHSPPKVGSRQLRNPRIKCLSGPSCPTKERPHYRDRWSTTPRHQILNNGTTVLWEWLTWSAPTRYELIAEVWELQVTASGRHFHDEEYLLEFGRIWDLEVPSDFTGGTISFQSYLRGHPTDLQLGRVDPDPDRLLQFLGEEDAGPGMKRLKYRIKSIDR